MDRGRFTGWLARRLSHIPQSSAYQAIEIFKGMSEEMCAGFAHLKPAALAEVAKAEPDVQALIAERALRPGKYLPLPKAKRYAKRSRGK
ncbi:hypothetical protein CWR43_30825 [Rhizobium sullae]|uniref:Uncharacterized protein n=1 Tax=Rhizobium sullae TaxID=50338 RepID=A0A2N0D0T9_RHISU|nr:hypothetical protein CWR43_30825 [Rhizobium sullae]